MGVLQNPDYIREAQVTLNSVVASGRLAHVDGGTHTMALERRFAAYLGVASCVACTSGSAALLMSLLSLNLAPGDEVIIPALTFIADRAAAKLAGATPIYVDCAPGKLHPSLADIERAVTSRTRAIVVVHLFGEPVADIATICEFASAAGITVIEDCCQAHGARVGERRVGSFGDYGCFSFSQGHIMACGGGGIVSARDGETAVVLRRLRFFGVSDLGGIADDIDRDFDLAGFNFGIGELNSALATIQLDRLELLIEERVAIAAAYQRSISQVPHLVPLLSGELGAVPHMFPVSVDPLSPFSRGELARVLRRRGVPLRVTYSLPLSQIAAERTSRPRRLPNADDLAGRVLSFPCGGEIGVDGASKIGVVLSEAVSELAESHTNASAPTQTCSPDRADR